MTRFSKLNIKNLIFVLVLFTVSVYSLNAEIISDKDFNYSMDLPEGYTVSSYSQDGLSYVFTHSSAPVNLILKISTNVQSKNSQKVLSENLTKLKAEYETTVFEWSEKNCAISTLKMNLDKAYDGWAVTSPLCIDNAYITLIAYEPEEENGKWNQFMISSMNSLCINENYYCTPGIVTTYAFPKEGKKNITMKISGNTVSSFIDKSDSEASKFLIDLEFAVLTLYQNHDLKIQAWQRFYRMIYRDSFGRIENVCSDIYDALFEKCKKSNPNNPELEYAQTLLSWIQTFSYKRASEKYQSDFTSIPAVLLGEGNDCDSRSMLLCILLKSCGIESIFYFSPVYSHAMAAAELNAPGQYFEIEGVDRKFLTGETTAKVTWGMISKDVSDRNNWIPVILP